MLPRSYLFVPADRPDRFDAAAESGADAIILDLEDGTAWTEKDRARDAVHEWLLKGHPEGIEVWVRVNGGDLLRDDLDASFGADGVFLPKIQGPGTIEDVAAYVDGNLKIIGMIETARALLRCEQIGGHDAVTGLMIGEFDLAADLGMRYDTMGRELDAARLKVVTVSAAYGLRPAIAGIESSVTDLDRIRRGTEHMATIGFGARGCVHQVQVDIVNEVFQPDEESVVEAKDLIARYERAKAIGSGVFLNVHGRVMDESNVRHARQVLELADHPLDEE